MPRYRVECTKRLHIVVDADSPAEAVTFAEDARDDGELDELGSTWEIESTEETGEESIPSGDATDPRYGPPHGTVEGGRE